LDLFIIKGKRNVYSDCMKNHVMISSRVGPI